MTRRRSARRQQAGKVLTARVPGFRGASRGPWRSLGGLTTSAIATVFFFFFSLWFWCEYVCAEVLGQFGYNWNQTEITKTEFHMFLFFFNCRSLILVEPNLLKN
jgi:hypothetical protein